ncbi:GFA family protein [Sphingomonas sp.]|uniref:GFA family protein n=1 Tax=Sphingomonas sp. TaxID=28214 RepID=UPI003B00770F
MTDTMTGGCQCGRVRYSVEVTDRDAYLCHCRFCQRATGGVAAALKQVDTVAVTWEREPDRYRSSPIAQRGFCRECGTPLTYEGDGSDGLDLTVGSFDDAASLRPVEHSGTESIIEAWVHTDDLPRSRTDENERINARWKDACGKLPD